MMPYGFNSILMDRGDRVSIQGDRHPTMAAALVAFGSPSTYDLVHKMLVKTDSGCEEPSQCKVVDSGLMPYPVYWASSVNDWYWASGDTARFLQLAPDMARIIDNAVAKFLTVERRAALALRALAQPLGAVCVADQPPPLTLTARTFLAAFAAGAQCGVVRVGRPRGQRLLRQLQPRGAAGIRFAHRTRVQRLLRHAEGMQSAAQLTVF